jgi:transposase
MPVLNIESAGKRRSGKTCKGRQHLMTALIQENNSAPRKEDSCLGAQYQCLAGRRGRKRAIAVVAHSILVIANHLMARKEPDRKLSGAYFL